MHGMEWVVEATSCSEESLRDLKILQTLFDGMIVDLHLRPVGETLWHQFPITGGITGLCLLAESHFACHTFPEHKSLCLNLFCCVPRPEWAFESELRARFGAKEVQVRRLIRSYQVVCQTLVSD
jgi:S-adenosylmethionine decarboxylase